VRWPARTGLRVRVGLIVALIAVPAIGLWAVAYDLSLKHAAHTAQENALRLARLAANEHGRLVAQIRGLLAALAIEVQEAGPQACGRFFIAYHRYTQEYANIGVAALDGAVLCSGVPMLRPVNIGDRDYFRRAIETRSFAAGEYQIGRIHGNHALNFGYPVVDRRGQITAVVFASLSLEWLSKAAAAAEMPPGSAVLVVDRRGTVLSGYPNSHSWIGKPATQVPLIRTIIAQEEGVTTAPGLDGVSRLHGFAALARDARGPIAYVVVGVPTQVAFAGVNRGAQRAGAALLAILVLALVAARIGTDALIIRPVNTLVAATERLRAGDYGVRTGLAHAPTELRRLSLVFDDMVGDLGAVHTHLRTALGDAERRLARLQALQAVDTAILQGRRLNDTLTVVLAKVLRELHVDAAAVLLVREGRTTLERVASRGFRAPLALRSHVPMDEGPAARAARERTVVHLPDLSGDRRSLSAVGVGEEGLVGYVAAPLIAQERVTGVLELFCRAPLVPNDEWWDFLTVLAGQAAIAVDNAHLLESMHLANEALTQAYDATLEGWSRALDLRDKETEGHSQRVTEMTLRLAEAMGVPEADRIHMRRGALLHDIGKMGVPDRILSKPSSLTSEEWEIMRKHPQYAYELLSPVDFLRPALDIPHAHHEKWDGSGYPRGLKGEEIPLAARIFAVVDSWDALRSARPYRAAWSDERVLANLRERAGRDFDPKVVAAFLAIIEGSSTGRSGGKQ
jgi:putative nucleotidyltransferase with HDIG domain